MPNADAVRKGLKKLEKAQPEDTVVLFLAGHGQNLQNSEYYFLPDGVRLKDGQIDPSSALSWRELLSALQTAQGRRVLLVDTCRAGNAYNMELLKTAQFDNIAVLSATDSEGVAHELEKFEHGAFTYALLQGLATHADSNNDGVVKAGELSNYVEDTVPRLTNDSQKPESIMLKANFPLVRTAGER